MIPAQSVTTFWARLLFPYSPQQSSKQIEAQNFFAMISSRPNIAEVEFSNVLE